METALRALAKPALEALEDYLGNKVPEDGTPSPTSQATRTKEVVETTLNPPKVIASQPPRIRTHSLGSASSDDLGGWIAELFGDLPVSTPEDHHSLNEKEARTLEALRVMKGVTLSPIAAVKGSSIIYTFPKPMIGGADDEAAIRRLMGRCLKEQSSELVPWSEDGAPFLKVLAELGSTLDVVLLDQNMKTFHGTDVLRKIKDNTEHPEWQEITTGLVSSESDFLLLEDGLPKWKRCGFDFFVLKPFTKEALLLALQNAYEELQKSGTDKRWLKKPPRE